MEPVSLLQTGQTLHPALAAMDTKKYQDIVECEAEAWSSEWRVEPGKVCGKIMTKIQSPFVSCPKPEQCKKKKKKETLTKTENLSVQRNPRSLLLNPPPLKKINNT